MTDMTGKEALERIARMSIGEGRHPIEYRTIRAIAAYVATLEARLDASFMDGHIEALEALSTASAEGIRDGLDETWLAEMIYSHALGCDPTSKTIKADGKPYGTWKRAVEAAAAIRAKIEDVRALEDGK